MTLIKLTLFAAEKYANRFSTFGSDEKALLLLVVLDRRVCK